MTVWTTASSTRTTDVPRDLRGPFVVDITPLRKVPGSAIHVERAGPLDGLVVTDVRVPADIDTAVTADLAWAQEDVVVTARVTARWEAECRRCLQPASGEVVVDVREVYEPTSDQEETYALSGSQVDLEPLVRDAVLLGLPAAPLCKEGCQGLCPTCGTDLNEGTCGCESSPADPRWSALDALRDPI
jgi:uncharacterized protein